MRHFVSRDLSRRLIQPEFSPERIPKGAISPASGSSRSPVTATIATTYFSLPPTSIWGACSWIHLALIIHRPHCALRPQWQIVTGLRANSSAARSKRLGKRETIARGNRAQSVKFITGDFQRDQPPAPTARLVFVRKTAPHQRKHRQISPFGPSRVSSVYRRDRSSERKRVRPRKSNRFARGQCGLLRHGHRMPRMNKLPFPHPRFGG